MASADRIVRGIVAIATFACATQVFGGGPLLVVPSGGTVKPARWEGTVNVYVDRGTLGVLDNAAANQLVVNALAQWSSVPTSSFRAQVTGSLPVDITGANANQVIGVFN